MKNRKIGFEIHRSSRLVKRYLDKDTAGIFDDNMTGTHGRAIGYFYHNSHRDIFQKDFEQEFDIRPSTASNILFLMEKNGLIARESVPYDARLKKITLTKKAVDIHHIIEGTIDKLEENLKSGISDEELSIFFRVIDKLNNNIERIDSDND